MVHEQFLHLISTHHRALQKMCWVYGTHSHDRDDLFQEMVAQLWSAFPRYDPARNFLTWMYRIGLNVAIDHLRRNKRRGKALTLAETDIDSLPSSQRHDRHQELMDLHHLMEQQSEADRALLLLYLEGQSHREIGDVLGMTESNVSTRLNRLKNSLRQSIQQDEQESRHAT